jgi:hypothetical protein
MTEDAVGRDRILAAFPLEKIVERRHLGGRIGPGSSNQANGDRPRVESGAMGTDLLIYVVVVVEVTPAEKLAVVPRIRVSIPQGGEGWPRISNNVMIADGLESAGAMPNVDDFDRSPF